MQSDQSMRRTTPHPALGATLCPPNVRCWANGRLFEQPPVAGSEPVATQGGPCGEARDRSGVFLKPEQLHGRESPHEQGRDWEYATTDAHCRPRCRKEQSRRLHSFRRTAVFCAKLARRRGRAGFVGASEPDRAGCDGGERWLRAELKRKSCAGPGSRSSLSTRSGSAISPRRPGGWPRTIRSTRRRSPGSARPLPISTFSRATPRARRSIGSFRPARP